MMSFLRLLAVVGFCAVFIAACDNAVPTSSDLLTDARIARQAGDINGAVALLEEALQAEPQNAAVRVELASALLERDDLDLLDLDRVAAYLIDASGQGATTPPPASASKGGDVCPYIDDPNATPFDPRDIEGYPELFENEALLQTIEGLLKGTDPDTDLSVIPDELRSLPLCGAVQDGELQYDRTAALAHLQGLGLTDQEIATALAVNAVTRFFSAYFFITEDIPQQTTWYRVETAEGSTIAVCAEDEAALREQGEVAVKDLGEAMTSLDLRATVLGGDTSTEAIIDHAVALYEAVEDDLGPYCDGQ